MIQGLAESSGTVKGVGYKVLSRVGHRVLTVRGATEQVFNRKTTAQRSGSKEGI